MNEQETVIEQGMQFVTVIQANGHRVKHNVKWLRFHCKCKECKQPFSGMYPLDATCLDHELNVASAKASSSELKCVLTGSSSQEHEVSIPLEYLLKTCNCKTCLGNDHKYRRPPLMNKKTAVYMDFNELNCNEGMLKCLEHIIESGYCVLRNSPIETKQQFIETLEKFGNIRTTFYGQTFDVKNVIDPVNIAYTDVKLMPHQDIHFYQNSPGIQILQAIRFDDGIEGGESQLLDLIECAEILRKSHPEEFEILARVPVLFRAFNHSQMPVHYHHSKPILDVDYFGEIVGVCWNPFTEREQRVAAEDLEPFYRAHKIFRDIIEDPNNQLQFKLQKNDFLIFNNRRLAHARQAYTASERAERHLLGGYVDIDDLKSRYVVLATKLGKKISTTNLGNRSSF